MSFSRRHQPEPSTHQQIVCPRVHSRFWKAQCKKKKKTRKEKWAVLFAFGYCAEQERYFKFWLFFAIVVSLCCNATVVMHNSAAWCATSDFFFVLLDTKFSVHPALVISQQPIRALRFLANVHAGQQKNTKMEVWRVFHTIVISIPEQINFALISGCLLTSQERNQTNPLFL